MSDQQAYNLPLTEDEIGRLEYLKATVDDLALVRVEHDGRPRAALAAVFFDGETYEVRPVALLVDDDLVAELNPGPEMEEMH